MAKSPITTEAVTLAAALERIAALEGQLAQKGVEAKQSAPGQAFEVVAGNLATVNWGSEAENPKATEGANVTGVATQVEDLSHTSYAIMPDGRKVEVQATAIQVQRYGAPIVNPPIAKTDAPTPEAKA